MKLALALLFVGAGLTLIYSGLTGEPLTPALTQVLKGQNPTGRIGNGQNDNPNAPGIAGSGKTPDVPPPQSTLPHAGPPDPNAAGDTTGGGTVVQA